MQLAIETNLLGDLMILKTMNIKPNFSALQRKYDIDRHTIKKYYLKFVLNLSTFSSLPCYKNLLMLVYEALIISKIYFARI